MRASKYLSGKGTPLGNAGSKLAFEGAEIEDRLLADTRPQHSERPKPYFALEFPFSGREP